MTRFMRWAGERRGRAFADYDELWRWSVAELEDVLGEHLGVLRRARLAALRAGARLARDAGRALVRGRGAQLRREHAAARARATPDEVGACCTPRSCASCDELTWGELAAQVAARRRRAARARASGAAIAWSPTCRTSPRRWSRSWRRASIGAIWSSAAPEFGARSVIDRFAQIEPKVLLAVDGYRHGGKDFDRTRGASRAILAELPTVRARRAAALPGRGRRRASAATRPAGAAAMRSSWSELLRARRGRGAAASSRCPSTTRCGCSTPPARPACRRRSCRATAGSCSSS